jgi:hypothetical protein
MPTIGVEESFNVCSGQVDIVQSDMNKLYSSLTCALAPYIT